MKKVVGLVIMISAVLSTVAPAHNGSFKREELSAKGQVAYDRLISACVFSIGSVGYAGTTSENELALYDLLEEPSGIEALKSLVTTASYEGGLYGLIGLSLKNNGEFNRAVDLYKARDRRPERPKGNSIGCHIIDNDDEQVTTQAGCILMPELRANVVTKIQSGRYDSWLLPKYRPRR